MKRLFYISLVFLLFSGGILSLKTSFSQTYNFDNFSVEDGLVQTQVLSICQDSKGYIWFGTNSGGISIYDGNKFSSLTKSDGLVDNVVYSIIEGKNGKMFIGTTGGLSVYDGHGFTNYTETDGLPDNMVFAVLEDAENNIVWLATTKGIAKLVEGKIEMFDGGPALNDVHVFTLYKDKEGNIWFGTVNKGAIKYDGKSFTVFNTEKGLTHSFVWTIIEDKDGNIWVGTIKGLNIINKNNKVEEIRINQAESQRTITSSTLSKDGDLWFGTKVGAVFYDGSTFKNYREQNGLSTNDIWSIMQDREGNIWFGTMGKGVVKFRYKGEVFKNYSRKDSLPNDMIHVIFEDSKGDYWLGSESGIAKMTNGQIKVFTRKNEDNINLGIATNTYSVAEDRSGNLWFATRGSGLFRYDGSDFKKYTINDGLNDNLVYSILIDNKGTMWFGTAKGVSKMENGEISEFGEITKINIWTIFQDKENNYWFATEKGASKYDGTSMQYFTGKDGFVDDRVLTVLQDNQGYYWFATDEGVFCYDSKKFKKISQDDGLSFNKIYLLVMDRNGDLWIGTTKGLDKLDVEAYHSRNEIKLIHYGKDEGFIGLECNSNAGYRDSKGHLWFGTAKGVTIFNPDLETTNTEEPLTSITNIRLEFEDFDWTEFYDTIDLVTKLPVNLTLPHNKNHLTFDYIGVSMTIPKKVKYQYKLVPLEDYWLHATDKNEAVYSHIPPGEYTFMVKAMNNDGLWNKQPVEFLFRVLPPWYQTWWFYTLCVVVAFAGVYSFITIRMRNLQKQKRVLEEKVLKRTAELRKEKEKVEQSNIEISKKNKIIETKNKDITDSIAYAKRIQEAILPLDNERLRHFPESFILFKPKDIVSGDFYWLTKKDEIAIIAAADCTGHGVPGAFMSMIGNSLLNEIVIEKGNTKPAKILDAMKEGIINALKQKGESGEQKDGMDIGLLALNYSKNTAEFAGAYNSLLLARKGELEEIKADRMPIGIFEDDGGKRFTNQLIELQKGDTLYIFSDGYTDQFGGHKGKKFRSNRFKQLILDIQPMSMDDQKACLDKTIEDWKAHNDQEGNIYEQLDDILVIGVRV
ncbi:MAG: two-component regulator propeller domain-containing protein [Bacteroidota bacterium]